MSDVQESPEQTRRRLEMRGFTKDQAQAVQQLATQMAHQQVQRAVAATNNFIATIVALVSSAVGFVAAFAWNTAFQTWISSGAFHPFGIQDKTSLSFMYAIFATIIAVAIISILGLVTSRLVKNGRNLLQPPTL